MPARKVKTNLEILLAAFLARKTNRDALAAVVAAHPHSKMSLSTVNWYRNRYKKEHPKIPSEHECNRRR